MFSFSRHLNPRHFDRRRRICCRSGENLLLPLQLPLQLSVLSSNPNLVISTEGGAFAAAAEKSAVAITRPQKIT
jgi:hypothetical protein